MYNKPRIIARLYTKYAMKKFFIYVGNSSIKRLLREYDPKHKHTKYKLIIKNKTLYEPVIFSILL